MIVTYVMGMIIEVLTVSLSSHDNIYMITDDFYLCHDNESDESITYLCVSGTAESFTYATTMKVMRVSPTYVFLVLLKVSPMPRQ